MIELLHLPPWSINYNSESLPSLARVDNFHGRITQSRRSHRVLEEIDVERRLIGNELPYFEWFFKGVIKDGSIAFLDSYASSSGVVSKLIRIVDGYSVRFNGRVAFVSARIIAYD